MEYNLNDLFVMKILFLNLGVQHYKGELKISYDDDISAIDEFFLPIESKHCYTDGRSLWTARETMLEN